ncbi:hypothetical protein FVE85_0193 [Porphyridium purpureum]|uniref:Uncharacterized protein n=1 Tax=Porphyridium purpureum TaxID=35688 RepID=A0A5J4Z0F0_PORPP|nr:hypothetical protein FVE85_0193 [Porphyridium purpureum]|eukprot:POR1381..scf208_2
MAAVRKPRPKKGRARKVAVPNADEFDLALRILADFMLKTERRIEMAVYAETLVLVCKRWYELFSPVRLRGVSGAISDLYHGTFEKTCIQKEVIQLLCLPSRTRLVNYCHSARRRRGSRRYYYLFDPSVVMDIFCDYGGLYGLNLVILYTVHRGSLSLKLQAATRCMPEFEAGEFGDARLQRYYHTSAFTAIRHYGSTDSKCIRHVLCSAV